MLITVVFHLKQVPDTNGTWLVSTKLETIFGPLLKEEKGLFFWGPPHKLADNNISKARSLVQGL